MEDVFPIENGDIPASYVSLPEGTQIWMKININKQLDPCTNLTNGPVMKNTNLKSRFQWKQSNLTRCEKTAVQQHSIERQRYWKFGLK